MLFLVLSISCSVCIGLLLKQNEIEGRDRVVVVAANYIVATAVNCVMWGVEGFGSISGGAAGLGVLTGFQFVASFLLMMVCMGQVGVAITVSLTRIALVLPVVVSIVVYRESPSSWQIAGLLFVLGAFCLLGKAKVAGTAERKQNGVQWLLLGALFLCMGLNGVNLKVFQEQWGSGQLYGFLTVLFATAGVCSWVSLLVRKRRVLRGDFLRGLVVGVPNGLSSIFFVFALSRIAGTVAFAVNDVSVVIVSTFAAIVIWSEKPNRYGWAAIGLSAVSIGLMNI